jgi:hypothetical protein
MGVLASPRHFTSLAIVPFLAAMLAFPASAQTGTDTNKTGTAGAQTDLTGAPTGSNTVAPSTPSSPAGKVESEPGGSQPQSSPGLSKVGSAILININKAKKK